MFFFIRAEKDDISSLSDRRLVEIERLHCKVKELNEENKRAVAAKCEAHARLEDLDAKEANIAYKEKRFNEEKSFLDSQIAMLQVTVRVT